MTEIIKMNNESEIPNLTKELWFEVRDNNTSRLCLVFIFNKASYKNEYEKICLDFLEDKKDLLCGNGNYLQNNFCWALKDKKELNIMKFEIFEEKRFYKTLFINILN